MRSPLNAGVHKNSTVPAARCDKVWKMTLRREPQETCGDLVLPANFRDCFRVTDQSEIRHSKFHGKFLFYQNERSPVDQTDTTTISLEEYEVLEEKDGYVLDESNTYTKTTTTNVGNNILVRGEKVDDFLSISKKYLWTISTSALQQVDSELQAEKARNDALEARLLAIEQQLAA